MKAPAVAANTDSGDDLAIDAESAEFLRPFLSDPAGRNPRTWPLRFESEWLVDQISEESLGIVESGILDGFDGCTKDGDGRRPLTNEELCFIALRIGDDQKSFDVRKPLPRAVGQWMREVAAKILTAAERVESLLDPRPRKLIRRFAAGDPSVKYSERLGLVDTAKPLPNQPWWEEPIPQGVAN